MAAEGGQDIARPPQFVAEGGDLHEEDGRNIRPAAARSGLRSPPCSAGGSEPEAGVSKRSRACAFELRFPELNRHVERDNGAWRCEFHATRTPPDDGVDRIDR